MLNLEKLKNLYENEVIEFRRDLHMYPELSFKEYGTTEKIKEKLISLGIEIIDLGLETGVVGLLKGYEDLTYNCFKRRYRCSSDSRIK